MINKKFLSNKTIEYIESIVYILAIITTIFAVNYGNIYIRMLPILMLLGIFGKVLFNRPVITTVFGITISICIIYMSGNILIVENIILSFCAGFSIAIGELIGKYLNNIYKCIKEKKNISNKKNRKNIIYVFLIIIFYLVSNDYINGNIFTYIKFKNKIYNYLENTYGNEVEFSIVNTNYNFFSNQKYIFKIKNNKYNEINRFVIYLKDSNIIDDGYKQSIIAKNNSKLSNKISMYLLNEKNIKLDDFKIDIQAEYTDINIIELKINKNVNIVNQESLIEYSIQIDNILKSLKEFEYYKEIYLVSIAINSDNNNDKGASSLITIEGFENYIRNNNNSYEYIIKSLNIEYIN